MSYIDHFADFLFDERRRLSSKAAVILFIILAVLLVDNLLGFSYSFAIDRKISQVQKLNTIIKDPSVDSSTKMFAINLRNRIIDRQDIVSQALSFFRGKSNNSIKHQANKPTATAKPIDVSIKNNFWFNFSASGFFFLLAIIMIPLMLFADKTTSFIQRLGTGIATTFSLVLFGFFFIWLLGFIPQISNSTWVWNYILNGLIQILMSFLFFYLGQKKRY